MKTRNAKLLIILLILSLLRFGPLKIVQALPLGTWHQRENMNVARSRHTATLLPDGTVLVAGGLTGNLGNVVTTPSAEIYNPNTGTWRLTSSMSAPRSRFTATLLPNGKVLVAGGSNNGFATTTAELLLSAVQVQEEIWSIPFGQKYSIPTQACGKMLHH